MVPRDFDGKSKFSYVKRFQVLSSTRDRLYNLSAGNKDSKILYFENRQNGESEVINVFIHSSQKARKKIFEFDFGNLAEEENHHPDISFGWGYCKVKIFTHAIKGLAESDFILAAKIDKISNA